MPDSASTAARTACPLDAVAPGRRLRRLVRLVVALVCVLIALAQAPSAGAQDADPVEPVTDVAVDGPDTAGVDVIGIEDPAEVNVTVTSDDSGLSRSVLIVLLLTIGSVAPAILLLMTCFTRFVIVLSLTRNALGAQALPPTQVLTGLSLILTLFVMAPVLTQINEDALQPLIAGDLELGEAWEAGYEPLRDFMLAQTDEDDLRLLYRITEAEQPSGPEHVPATTLMPAFVLSELRTAFTIGFVVFVPFLIIDLVIASILMSMGMVMLPPVFISLPVKLLLFVLVDGWALIVGSLVESVNVVG